MVTWWPQRSPVALFTRNCVFTYQVRWSSLRFTVHWLVFLVLVSPYRFSLQFKWNHVLRTGLWLYGSIVVSRSCVTIGPVFLVSDQKDHICQIHVHLCVCVWAQTQWWYQLLWAVWAWTLWRKKKKRPVFFAKLEAGVSSSPDYSKLNRELDSTTSTVGNNLRYGNSIGHLLKHWNIQRVVRGLSFCTQCQ